MHRFEAAPTLSWINQAYSVVHSGFKHHLEEGRPVPVRREVLKALGHLQPTIEPPCIKNPQNQEQGRSAGWIRFASLEHAGVCSRRTVCQSDCCKAAEEYTPILYNPIAYVDGTSRPEGALSKFQQFSSNLHCA